MDQHSLASHLEWLHLLVREGIKKMEYMGMGEWKGKKTFRQLILGKLNRPVCVISRVESTLVANYLLFV